MASNCLDWLDQVAQRLPRMMEEYHGIAITDLAENVVQSVYHALQVNFCAKFTIFYTPVPPKGCSTFILLCDSFHYLTILLSEKGSYHLKRFNAYIRQVNTSQRVNV